MALDKLRLGVGLCGDIYLYTPSKHDPQVAVGAKRDVTGMVAAAFVGHMVDELEDAPAVESIIPWRGKNYSVVVGKGKTK